LRFVPESTRRALKVPHHRLTDFHLKIGCTANCLHPGFVATRFGDQSGGVISRFVGLASKSLRIEVSRFADMVGRPRIQQKGCHRTSPPSMGVRKGPAQLGRGRGGKFRPGQGDRTRHPAIWGSNGHTYAVPEGFQLMIGCDFDNARWTSARGWESAKKRLGFGAVTQDGDCEGSIILDRLPSKSEAAEIRDILGIPKRIELSEGQLANLRAHAAANAFKPVLPASTPEPATIMGP
jgi:hypothetical protein